MKHIMCAVIILLHVCLMVHGQSSYVSSSGSSGYGDRWTEEAVLKVLWWLKATQKSDGSWGPGNKPANIGFALLTFLAHGEYPDSESPYQRDFGPVVRSAVDWMCSHVHTGPDGKCYISESDGNEYAFLIATYAMSEAYGMTKNPSIKDIAIQMLDRIVKGQGPTGGWDYKLNSSSSRDDVSFMGWAIQALKAGKMAGLHPDGLDAAINKAIYCLKTRNYSKTGGFTYTPILGNTGGRTGLAGVGTLAMQLFGHGFEPEARNGLNVMRTWHPTFNPESLDPGNNLPGPCPQYYCYYATQCKYLAGMRLNATREDKKTWIGWNNEMKATYPKAIKDLPEKVTDCEGKYHKQGYYKNEDRHTSRPVMDTCLAALQLMVYYRHAPFEERRKQVSALTQAPGRSEEQDGDGQSEVYNSMKELFGRNIAQKVVGSDECSLDKYGGEYVKFKATELPAFGWECKGWECSYLVTPQSKRIYEISGRKKLSTDRGEKVIRQALEKKYGAEFCIEDGVEVIQGKNSKGNVRKVVLSINDVTKGGAEVQITLTDEAGRNRAEKEGSMFLADRARREDARRKREEEERRRQEEEMEYVLVVWPDYVSDKRKTNIRYWYDKAIPDEKLKDDKIKNSAWVVNMETLSSAHKRISAGKPSPRMHNDGLVEIERGNRK